MATKKTSKKKARAPKKATKKRGDTPLLIALILVAVVLAATISSESGLLKGLLTDISPIATHEQAPSKCPTGFLCSSQMEHGTCAMNRDAACGGASDTRFLGACGTADCAGTCFRCLPKPDEQWQTCPSEQTCSKVGFQNTRQCDSSELSCPGGKKVCDGTCGRKGCRGRCCHCENVTSTGATASVQASSR